MATNIIVGAAGSGVYGATEAQTFYDKVLLLRALPKLVHAQAARKATIPSGSGVTVAFRRFESLAGSTTALTEGTPPSESTPTISITYATISQYGQYIKVSDILEMQAVDPVITEFTEVLGESMGTSLDQVQRDVIVAGTVVQYASTAGSRAQVGSGMYLNTAEIREATTTLKNANAQTFPGSRFISFIHPNTTRDLMADTNLLNAWQYAANRGSANPLFSGEVGEYLGVKFIETTNAKNFASLGFSGADVYGTMFIAKEAYAITELSSHQAKIYVKPGYDPLEQFKTIGYKAAMACIILNNNFMVRVEHVTSAKNAA